MQFRWVAVLLAAAVLLALTGAGAIIMSGTPAQRSRVAARGWVTRAANKLEKLCLESALVDAVEEFDLRLCTLDATQSECELEYTSETGIVDDVEKAADFHEKSRVFRVKATKLLSDLLPQSDNDGSQAAAGSICTVKAVEQVAKLPKLELPRFSGKATEWPSFWDKFSAIVDTADIPIVTKFTYLQSLLDGDAKSAIAGLSLTGDHYNIACDILCNRFGRHEKIIFAHIQELMNITMPSKQCKVEVLWKLQDSLQAHVRSLEAQGALNMV